MPAMTAPRFIHLRLHFEYSVTDGIVRLGDAVRAAVADRMQVFGIDFTQLFQRKCRTGAVAH